MVGEVRIRKSAQRPMSGFRFVGFGFQRQPPRSVSAISSLGAAVVLLAGIVLAGFGQPSQAQTVKHRRETSVNRQRRNQLTIKDAYTHQWELGLGGTYLRAHTGETMRKTNLAGFGATGTYYFSPKWGLVGDVRGYFGNARVYPIFPNNYNVFDPLISEFTFMAGPQMRIYRKAQWSISPHVLAGMVKGDFSGGTKGVDPALLGIYPDSLRAAFSPGFNVDYNIFPNLALRATPNAVFTTFGGSVQTNLGANLGLVYRFGRQK